MCARFAEFEYDQESGQLLAHGSRVAIQEKPLRILAILLAQPGRLVTREQISREVWAGTFVVEDQSLNTAIRKLRLALGDSPHAPRFIETVGSKGYRFIHPVDSTQQSTTPRTLTLAVLPLENLGDESEEYLSDGLTGEMIARVGRLRPNFSVIALSSVLRYKKTGTATSEILRELGADFILSGSIRHSGKRVRIAIRLVKGEDQSCVWSQTYDRLLEDVFAIEAEVAENVARATSRILGSFADRHSPSSAANEVYLRGRFFWNKRTAPALLKSVELFNSALAEDPEYVLAYVGLADAYIMLVQYGVLPGIKALPIVKHAALKALELDPSSAESHVCLGWVKACYEHDLAGAEAEYKTALELDPNYSFAYNAYAFLLTATGRHDESIEFMRRGLQIDPVSLPMNAIFASTLYFARRYDEAIEQCKECVELDPAFSVSYAICGQALEALGQYPVATDHFRRHAELAPWNAYSHAHLARIYALQNLHDQSKAELDRLLQEEPSRHVPPYYVALVYAALRDNDATIDWLERAYDLRSNWIMFMNVDPKLDQLHSDPRFDQLLTRLALK